MSPFILEIKPGQYVGELTALGYGTTTIRAQAISFKSITEALEWQYDNPLYDAAFIVPFNFSLPCAF